MLSLKSTFDAMPREPVAVAKWMLIVFAACVLAFDLSNADALDVVFLSFAFLPWFVGPAAVAALLATFAKSRISAWLFLGAEAAAVASTAAVWAVLIFVRPDAQNGVAMIILPLFQFAALCIYGSIVALSIFFCKKIAA